MRRERKLDYVLILLSLMGITACVVCLSPRSLQAEEQSVANARKVSASIAMSGPNTRAKLMQRKPQCDAGIPVDRVQPPSSRV